MASLTLLLHPPGVPPALITSWRILKQRYTQRLARSLPPEPQPSPHPHPISVHSSPIANYLKEKRGTYGPNIGTLVSVDWLCSLILSVVSACMPRSAGQIFSLHADPRLVHASWTHQCCLTHPSKCMISVVSIFQVSVAGMGPAHDGNMQHSVQSLAEFGCLIKYCNSEMLKKKKKI